MSLYDFLLIVIVGVAAFYTGYQLGRASVLRSGDVPADEADESPLPSPHVGTGQTAPRQPRANPPPASAGGDTPVADAGRRAPPRRSSKPPPAAAGLMGKGKTSED